jgi:hemerythrin
MADSPFKLFEPYGPADKDIFFGRDAEIHALYNLLRQTRLVLIYGASGTGKTSLISAGLSKVFNLSDWFQVSIRRRDDLNVSLRREINRLLEESEPITDLADSIQALFKARWIPIYLVFDQFEEVFTLGNEAERRQFFQDLQMLLKANLPCKILLSMREEYIGHLYEYEPIVPALFEKRFRLEPMQDGKVETVIEQMCDLHDIELEQPDATEASASTAHQILQQLKEGKQAAYLPYVQVYLHYLYLYAIENLGRPFFTARGIAAIGQLGNVLRRFIEARLEAAQTFLRGLNAPDDLAPRLLDEFATDEGTKRPRKRAELVQALQVAEPLVHQALYHFSDTAKLLRADEDDVERYEPVHDAIAKQIHELRSAEDKEFKAFTRHLQLSWERWISEGKLHERLLPERDISKAEVYRERLQKREEYGNWESYITESVRYVKRRKARRRNFNIVLGVVTVLALLASAVALNYSRQARKEQQRAEKALLNYKVTEWNRYMQDAETFTKSGDSPFALNALYSADTIQEKYFPDSIEWKKRVEVLRDSLQ